MKPLPLRNLSQLNTEQALLGIYDLVKEQREARYLFKPDTSAAVYADELRRLHRLIEAYANGAK